MSKSKKFILSGIVLYIASYFFTVGAHLATAKSLLETWYLFSAAVSIFSSLFLISLGIVYHD